ncbi:hypothetical protein IMX26_01565 [Clostridium sp. 'deep sea']|uniref:hypothetical protein n=1 Tax=Clostridium sp. 'deep sea' TaxID=2779445 RepID=UPI001896A490|nr:hypothetical protein [Clostridium sp. 'deep sea']QOR35558.1 hypothetical protein IMX26_01565 [Clostridium sp. 'deep sea']
MKKIIRQIKKGNLRYYISLIDNYIGSIYKNSLDTIGQDKAKEITISVFEQLYMDILNSLSWQNAENLIQKSLKHSCRVNKIPYNIMHNQNIVVPPQIKRELFVKLSKHSNRSQHKKNFAIPAVVIIIVLLLGFSGDYNNRNMTNYTRSIENVDGNQEIIYQLFYSDISPSTTVSNIMNLEDKGVIVDIRSDNKHDCEIWYKGKKYNEFSLEDNGEFQWGNFEQDSLVFRKKNKLFKYSLTGVLKNTIDVSGMAQVKSSNKRYVSYKKDSQSLIFDMKEFEFIETYQDRVLAISNTGFVITSKAKVHSEAKQNAKCQVIGIKAISDCKAVVVNSFGEVALYENDVLKWKKNILKDKEIENSSGRYYVVNIAYIFGDEHTVNIVIDFGSMYMVQSYNCLDGTERISTLKHGTFVSQPSVSNDNNLICLEYILYYNYSKGALKPSSNGVELLDLSSIPAKLVGLKDTHVLHWATEKNEDERYVYICNNNYLKVMKVKIS